MVGGKGGGTPGSFGGVGGDLGGDRMPQLQVPPVRI